MEVVEAVEAGLPEGGVDQTGTEVGASLEAEEGEAVAVASEANKPLHEKVLYIFLRKKNPVKTLGHCAVNKYIYISLVFWRGAVGLCQVAEFCYISIKECSKVSLELQTHY